MTGLLFDLDGTLLDTTDDLLDAANHALTVCGYPAVSRDQLRRAVGNGAFALIRGCMPPEAGREEVERVLCAYFPYYNAHCQDKTRPYPGIPEALAKLGKKYPIAIVSNKPDDAVKALCDLYFPGIFALGERPDCPRKPDPAMLHHTQALLGVDRCVYIGDSEVDVVTAGNAGMPCLAVTWGFREEEDLVRAGARHLCRRGEDLPRCLESLI